MAAPGDSGAVSLQSITGERNSFRATLTLRILLLLLLAAAFVENTTIVIRVVILSAPTILMNTASGLGLYTVMATSGAFFPFAEGISLSRVCGLLRAVDAPLEAFFCSYKLRLRPRIVLFATAFVITNVASLLHSLSLEGNWLGNLTMKRNLVVFLITPG